MKLLKSLGLALLMGATTLGLFAHAQDTVQGGWTAAPSSAPAPSMR
jgi:hypothetical protein